MTEPTLDEYLAHLRSLSVAELVEQGAISARKDVKSEKLIEYEMWRREFEISAGSVNSTVVVGVAAALVTVAIYGASFSIFSVGWFISVVIEAALTFVGIAVLRSMNAYLRGERTNRPWWRLR